MPLDTAAIRSLAGMTDEIGVLSIYANADPHEDRIQAPAWHKRIRTELGQLDERLRAEGPRERSQAFSRRRNAFQEDLDWLLDRSQPGQGRALFAGIADGETQRVALQMPLVDRVVLEPRAHLWPLVSAWSMRGPAGVAAVSAENTRLIDLRFGSVDEPAGVRYDPGGEHRQLTGPAAAHPGMAQHSASQHDLFEHREGDRLLRRVRSVGSDVARFAEEYEWEYVVVTGDASLTRAVISGLPSGCTAEAVELDHPVSGIPAPKLAAMVEPALAAARHRRAAALAQRACDGAMSGHAGSCGLPKTLSALQEKRVARLLLTADGAWRGRRDDDGMLVPATAEAEPDEVEPFLGERMLELALAEGAEVTMIDAEAAEVLDDGIGAILRW